MGVSVKTSELQVRTCNETDHTEIPNRHPHEELLRQAVAEDLKREQEVFASLDPNWPIGRVIPGIECPRHLRLVNVMVQSWRHLHIPGLTMGAQLKYLRRFFHMRVRRKMRVRQRRERRSKWRACGRLRKAEARRFACGRYTGKPKEWPDIFRALERRLGFKLTVLDRQSIRRTVQQARWRARASVK